MSFLFGSQPLRFNHAVAALLTVQETGHYLMQLRDDKPGIFYPDHWGCFGGAVEPGEEPLEALLRELDEELALKADGALYFTEMEFALEAFDQGRCWRKYYQLSIPARALAGLKLGEGRRMEAMAAEELLLGHKIVPYDSFAIWMHHAHGVWHKS